MTITEPTSAQASDSMQTRELPAVTAPVGGVRPAPKGTRRRKADVRVIVTVVVPVALGLLAVWFLLFATMLTGLRERGTQARLYERFRSELAQETVPISAPIQAGAPVAMINAAGAGLRSVVVVEGTTAGDLTGGPGHRSDSPLPGQAGLSVIYGRSLTFGGPFGRIANLKPGDPITVTTGQGVFVYKVGDVRRAGDPIPPAPGPTKSRLTLVTSGSGGWRSGWAPSGTIYVDADLASGQVSAVPATLPASVSRASMAMQGQSGAVVGFIFWLEALAVVAVAILWSWSRWGRLQTTLVGGPLLVATLWATSDQLALLLPNLI